MSSYIIAPSINNSMRPQPQYAPQQVQYVHNNGPVVHQHQPVLHEAPIVYGNSNLHHYYQRHQFNNQMMHTYPPPPPPPPQILCSTPSSQSINYYPQQGEIMTQSSPSSHSSSASGSGSPRTPPPSSTTSKSTPQALPSPTTNNMIMPLTTSRATTEERIKDTIARANAVPAEFFQTEFLEYSKKSYEVHQNAPSSRKRKRTVTDDSNASFKKFNIEQLAEEDRDDSGERLNNSEIRRQIHIQSEQKRRAQIKDGFEVLKSHLPGCANKKMSKATLLTRTVQQLEHMKKMQSELLAEVERLAEENLNLKSSLSNQVPY